MKLWNDECGAILSAELVLVMTIVGIAMVVGLKAIQASVLNEMDDVADAVGAVSQSYTYGGVAGCCASVEGGLYGDIPDTLDLCEIQVCVQPTPEHFDSP